MNYPDLINGAFELGGGLLCWVNVRKILKDKMTAGIYWPVSAFFAVWGLWNLYYYPQLGQMLSFWGGVFLVGGNSTWVALAAYYGRKNNAIR